MTKRAIAVLALVAMSSLVFALPASATESEWGTQSCYGGICGVHTYAGSGEVWHYSREYPANPFGGYKLIGYWTNTGWQHHNAFDVRCERIQWGVIAGGVLSEANTYGFCAY